ncbi:MAG: CoA pyrophosphatase [Beijerinckiaceae bacterium]
MTTLERNLVWQDVALFAVHARARLLDAQPALSGRDDNLAGAGDHVLNPGQMPADHAARARAAAVLIPIVRRPVPTVLLTQRAGHLRDHAGQVAFPGGKIDEADGGALGAALREAHEEIGLASEFVTPLGYLPPYLTGSGFRILPVVGLVEPGFSLHINRAEVDDAFEVPLAYLMDAANHEKQSREWKGLLRHYYTILFEGRTIWGVTAGIVRQLSDRLETP